MQEHSENKMSPLIKKIFKVGIASKAVIIPKSWLTYYEQQTGQKITELAMEVDRVLIVQPILSRKEQVTTR